MQPASTGPDCGRKLTHERLESRRLLAITVAHDPAIVGNGAAPADGFNLTVDSETGFQWLDLTLSTGFSFEEVAVELGPGGLFDGFRFATAPEIADFWRHAGVNVPNSFQFEDANVNPLIRTWGITRDPAFLDHSFANYDESGVSADPTRYGMAFLSSNTRGTEQAEFRADYDFSAGLFPSNVAEAGSALIRGGPGDPDPIGSIQGTKYHDLDGDGYQDAGEPGLPDWTIYLDDNDNGLLDPGEVSTQTDVDGRYLFAGLSAPDEYTVREVARGGWEQTAPQRRIDGDGELTFVDLVADGSLDKTYEVVVSPDGAHVYAVAAAAITVYQRDPSSGALTSVEVLRDGFADGQGNIVSGIAGAIYGEVSPDGEHFYVVGDSNDSVGVFRRDVDTGQLTFVEAVFDGGLDAAGNLIDGLGGISGLNVSPDSTHVYVTGFSDNALVTFLRDPATGRLTWIEALFNGSVDGQGNVINGIFTAGSPRVSPDGAFLYATGVVQDSVAVFSREAASGRLAFVEFFAEGGYDQHGNAIPGLSNAQHLEISPDGQNVYLVGNVDDFVAVFSRDAATGRLTLLEHLVNGGSDSLGNVIDGLDFAQTIDISPGGSHVYVQAWNDVSLVTFNRDQATGRLVFADLLQQGGLDGQGNTVSGLIAPFGVTVTPDGAHVYTADRDGDAVGIFSRDPGTLIVGSHVVPLEPGENAMEVDFGNLQLESAPPVIDDQAFDVDENSPIGTVVGVAAATDPDAGESLSFSIVGGTGVGVFALDSATGEITVADSSLLDYETTISFTLDVEVADPSNQTDGATITISVNPVNDNAPTFTSNTFVVVDENTAAVVTLAAADADLPTQTITFQISGNGPDDEHFEIVSGNNLRFIAAPDYETPLDADLDNVYLVEVLADDNHGLMTTQIVEVEVLNLASITGVVFVDVDQDGAYDANEPGVDGVQIDLQDGSGSPILESGDPVKAITSDGGFYLFEDIGAGVFRLFENQPTGVTDGSEMLGNLGGAVVANDTMQLTLDRVDAADYAFAELGQEVTSGDTATIGFWQNKHGQALIDSGGQGLANWLATNFADVFGDAFDSASVADFYKQQLFKQRGKKVAGPAKVDAQFMAVAMATYFTSTNLSGSLVAANYGFNVTQTGIGVRIVNVGNRGTAFGVADGTDLTISQLLHATDDLTDLDDQISGFAHIYDTNGDGVIDSQEAALRSQANELYTLINEQGDI